MVNNFWQAKLESWSHNVYDMSSQAENFITRVENMSTCSAPLHNELA